MKRRQASSVIEAQCRKSISAKAEHLGTEGEEEEVEPTGRRRRRKRWNRGRRMRRKRG